MKDSHPFENATLPFNHATIMRHVKISKIYIFTFTRLTATKLGRAVAYEKTSRKQILKLLFVNFSFITDFTCFSEHKLIYRNNPIEQVTWVEKHHVVIV